jgi:hypothetical protein
MSSRIILYLFLVLIVWIQSTNGQTISRGKGTSVTIFPPQGETTSSWALYQAPSPGGPYELQAFTVPGSGVESFSYAPAAGQREGYFRFASGDNLFATPQSVDALSATLANFNRSISKDVNLGATPTTFASLDSGIGSVALVLGDSIAFDAIEPAIRNLQRRLGVAGIGGLGHQNELQVFFGGGARFDPLQNLPNSAYVDFYNSTIKLSTPGDTVEFAAEYQVRIYCNSMGITYLRKTSESARFQVEMASTSDGAFGTWVPLGSELNLSPVSTPTAESVSFAVPAGYYRLRVRLISGSVNIVGCRFLDTTSSGIALIAASRPASDMTQYTGTPEAVRRGFLVGMAPTVVFVRYYDNAVIVQAGLPVLKADLDAASATLGRKIDLVLVGPSKVVNDGRDALFAQGEAMRGFATANGLPYIDLWDVSPDGLEYIPDGTHPNSVTYRQLAQRVEDALGWNRYAAVETASSPVIRTAVRKALVNIESTTFTPDAELRIPTASGRWRVEWSLYWGGTPGLGFVAQLS